MKVVLAGAFGKLGSDILKDIAKADSALSKACYYDSMRGADSDKKY